MKFKVVFLCISAFLCICLLFSCSNNTPAPEKATYKIVYYGNGSTSGEVKEQSGEEGTSFFVSDGAVLEYKCHSFSSWNTSKDGSGKSYNPGDEYKAEANLVLFAQWNESHDWTTVEGKASSCTERGWGSYQVCSKCGKSDKVLLPLAEHSYLETVADEYLKSPATCTESAVYYKTCSMCHSLTEETFSYGTSLGHDYINHDAKASTCTVQGWNAYQTCSRCPYSTKELSSLAEHNYINKVDDKYLSENATCSKEAVYYKSCSACGAKSSETFNSGSYLEHNLIHTDAKEPTCTTAGWDAYDSCTRCDYTTKVEKKALGHDKVSHTAKAATCTEKGYAAYETCTRCTYSTYSEIPASGHSYVDHEAQTPTCTSVGWDAYKTCSRCGDSTYVEKAALGHDYITHTAKSPTCTEIGWNEYVTCSRCDYTNYKELSATGHSYSTVWTTDSTYHWHTATCEHTNLISEKAQHTWGSDNKCTVCGMKNEGNSGITIDPSEYTVALAFPGEWNGSLHVVPGVKGTVKASLSPSDTKAEYAFFFDGVRLVAEGDELVLGKGEGKLNLEEGWHVLIIMAELDGNTYQNRYVIQVSSAGTGTADTDGEV